MTSEWFSAIITKQEQGEVERAIYAIEVKLWVGCIVARNITTLIDARCPDWAPLQPAS